MSTAGSAAVIVVGLGAMGSSAAFQLAARGVSVIGVDRYAPPHAHGSTHGETRITRLAIGEGAEFVPLVRRSHELWREIEQRSGTRIRTRTGGLILGHATSPFLAETRAAAREHGIDHERLSSDDLGRRFPMFAVDPETEAYYEPEAGYLRPEAAVAAQLSLAREHGAELRLGERVRTWEASHEGVVVHTDVARYEGQQLVLCAGAWISQLWAPSGEFAAVYRQLLHWFPIRRGYEQLRDMPIFVWDLGGASDGIVHLSGFYGFPAIDGPGGGVKVAAESYEHTSDPDRPQETVPGRPRETAPDRPREAVREPEVGHVHAPTAAFDADASGMYDRYLARYLPWLGPGALRTIPCLYTSTRGSRFVIDRHPEHDTVLIVSACSGHGFKHSPAIGEAVAQCVTTGASDIDLTAFRLANVWP